MTGADGFTGRYLLDCLENAGWETYALTQRPGQFKLEVVADLLNEVALETAVADIKPDAVIHLAGIAFVGYAKAIDFYQVNMFGTLNLMSAIKSVGLAPKIIIASSANVYGSPDLNLISELTRPSPINHYAMSKLAMEYMVKSYFADLNILISRPFNYTGRGQNKSFIVPKIVDHFKRKADFIELGNLDVARDYLDVRDVAAAYLSLLEKDSNFDTVNICSGNVVSLEKIILRAQEITEHQIEVRVNPEFVRSNEIKSLCGDNSCLREIGWSNQYSFDETLSWMLAEV